jgi:glycerol uptake facilitator protein
VGLFQIAAVWIIGVTMAISVTASISGAHLNPAVSVMFALLRPTNKFNWKKVLPYSIAQLLGAIIASWMNYLMYASAIRDFELAQGIVRNSSAGLATAKMFGEYYVAPVTTAQAFMAEAFGTAVLGGVIMAVTHPKNDVVSSGYVPGLIGMTVGALISVLAPLTQAGFNPARDFGPRLIAHAYGWSSGIAYQNWWVYVLAPIVGAPIGGFFVDRILFASSDEEVIKEEQVEGSSA